MGKYFIVLALIAACAVFVAGSSAMLSSKMIINEAKKDALESILKTEALALTGQIDLLGSLIDQQVNNPEIIAAISQNNPELIAQVADKVRASLPGAHTLYFLSIADINKANVNSQISFADLTMLKNAFEKQQPVAIQGDETNRYLAITRTVSQNNTVIGVVLAGMNFEFIERTMAGINNPYVELRQDKLVLASAGKKSADGSLEDNQPVSVPNTLWQLYYQTPASASLGENSLMTGIVLIPVLCVILGVVIVHRLLSKTLSEDMSWITRGLKDAMSGKTVPHYPAKLNETKVVISTLGQFNRIVNDKSFEI
jgi:phosphomannomutase/phosphoglucomutase